MASKLVVNYFNIFSKLLLKVGLNGLLQYTNHYEFEGIRSYNICHTTSTSLTLVGNTQYSKRCSPFRMDVIYRLLIRRSSLFTRDFKQNIQDIRMDYANLEKDGNNKAGFMGHLVLLEQRH